MNYPCRLALVGLPPDERKLLQGLFLEDLQRGHGYELVADLEQADLVIANADDVSAVRSLQSQKLQAEIFLIGESDAGTGWPVLNRPIRLRAVMEAVSQVTPRQREMDSLSPETRASDLGPAFEATMPFAPLDMAYRPGARGDAGFTGQEDADRPQFEATQPFESEDTGAMPIRPPPAPAARPAPVDRIDAKSVLMWRDAQASTVHPQSKAPPLSFTPAPASSRAVASGEAPREPRAAAPENYGMSSIFPESAEHPTSPQSLAGDGPEEYILLVGEPRLSESSLIRVLRSFGFRVDHVADGDIALTRLTSQSYRFVFLDAPSLGEQTLPVCRAIRKRSRAMGTPLRQVVIAREKQPIRRFFARLAGCDEWMVLPLNRTLLERYVRSS
jgi:CheY-like chemotaxis protein